MDKTNPSGHGIKDLGACQPSAVTASPVLRTEPASSLGPDGRVPHGAAIFTSYLGNRVAVFVAHVAQVIGNPAVETGAHPGPRTTICFAGDDNDYIRVISTFDEVLDALAKARGEA